MHAGGFEAGSGRGRAAGAALEVGAARAGSSVGGVHRIGHRVPCVSMSEERISYCRQKSSFRYLRSLRSLRSFRCHACHKPKQTLIEDKIKPWQRIAPLPQHDKYNISHADR